MRTKRFKEATPSNATNNPARTFPSRKSALAGVAFPRRILMPTIELLDQLLKLWIELPDRMLDLTKKEDQ